jgi:alpha-L-rhamnosidase
MRSAVLFKRFVLAAVVGVSLFTCAVAGFAAPMRLKVEQRVNPLGIDAKRPVFSWQNDSLERGWKQSAYQIRVATTLAGLNGGKPDVWDSGKIDSGESVGVPFGGHELIARQRYYWTVEVWDARGHSTAKGRSTHALIPGWWEMGLLASADWSGKWIYRGDKESAKALREAKVLGGPGAKMARVEQPTKAEFRYQLHLDSRPFAASLHVFSPGAYTAKVNGIVTGHKSSWGSFDREEIADRLHVGAGAAGDNEIIVSVESQGGRRDEQPLPATLTAVLRLEEREGKAKMLLSGKSWQVNAGGQWGAATELGPLNELPMARAPYGPSIAPPERLDSEASLLRKDFGAQAGVVSARLYVTAMGSYRFFLNGHRVGDDILTPGFTDFRKRALYQTYDVTPLVSRTGTNVLAAALGAGWHGSPLMWLGARIFPGPDMLRAQLELKFADGKTKTIATDGSWKTMASPVQSSEIYAGEVYDARLMMTSWNTGKAEGSWSGAEEGSAPAGVEVTAQPDRSIHQTGRVRPVSVKPVGGNAIFDMGQNMVGAVRLRVHGAAGTIVRLRFAERLNPDGSIYTENLRNADATDTYVLSGKGEEIWQPMFTFHGFRYVEVSGFPGNAGLDAIEGEVWNSLDGPATMRLKTSSAMLNSMYELGIWGQKGNFVSIPTDCPQRDERLGWMGDAGVFWRTGSYNFDIGAFTHKFMQDVVDAQTPGGGFTDVAPDTLGNTDEKPGAPGWGDAGIFVPYAAWVQYGDRALLERNWPAMERWMDFILRTNPNYLRQKALGANFADWLAPDSRSPKDLVATAYWAIIALEMETMSRALGKTEDEAKYRELYSHVAEAYRGAFVHSDGTVAGDTQTAYVLTLYAHLAPKEMEKGMTERLVKDIESHGNHLTTGFLGTPFLMFVLEDQNRADVAYKLLLQDTYPSWGYMVKKGATTWWERWNGDTGDPAMNSYNHYAFGSVMAWVYQRVAGVDTDASGAGFHHLTVKPHAEAGLTSVRAEYDSVYGEVRSEWTKSVGGKLALAVHIPANATATVYLPGAGVTTVMESGKKLEAKREGESLLVEVGAGSYHFALK